METEDTAETGQPNPLSRRLGLRKSTAGELVAMRRRSDSDERDQQTGESTTSPESDSRAVQ